MDNLTHSLLGLTIAKAGLEKLSPGSTAVCLIAANAPDADILVGLVGDRWDVLHHHRGITHAIVGCVVLGVVIPLLFYAGDIALSKFRRRSVRVRLKALFVASLVASASHPLLDWTNNYGIRLLLPWKSRWFYGDLVFIVDPFIWLILGTSSFLLTSHTKRQRVGWILLGFILSLLVVSGARRNALPNPLLLLTIWSGAIVVMIVLFIRRAGERWGSRIAAIALALLFVYWGALGLAHRAALGRANQRASSIVGPGEKILRLAAMPTLANPLRWDCVFETDRATYRFPLALRGTLPNDDVIRYEKSSPGVNEVMQKLSQDRRVQIFLGFARFPVARLEDSSCTTKTLVQFADLRYTEPGRSRGTFSLDLPVDCPNSTLTPSR